MLKTAVMAHRLGIGFEYCMKRYVEDENVDQSWLDPAEQLDRGMSESINAAFLSPESDKSNKPN